MGEAAAQLPFQALDEILSPSSLREALPML
jgi:hypothetical protein